MKENIEHVTLYLSAYFMSLPCEKIRTNILLSTHNLKLKFMLYILKGSQATRQRGIEATTRKPVD